MAYNQLSGSTSQPMGKMVKVSGSFSGAYNGNGLELANVSHITQANAAHQRIIFFDDSMALGPIADRNIRGSADFTFDWNGTRTLSVNGTGSFKNANLTNIQSGETTIGRFLALDSSNNVILTSSAAEEGLASGQGPTNSLQFHVGSGEISGSSEVILDSSALKISTGLVLKRILISSSVSVGLDDYYIGVSNSLGTDLVLTLPSASILSSGQTFVIKDEFGNAGVDRITISASSTNTIDGNNFVSIESPHGALSLYTDGSNKFFIY